MSAPRILFLVNGLGLGNSTRCHAIIERLHGKGAIIEMVTSGNGAWYFANRPEISRIHQAAALQYGKKDGKISIARTLLSVADGVRTVRDNARKVEEIIADFRPQAIVTDSEYSCAFARTKGIPVVALNNADVVYHSIHRYHDRPRSILPQFYAVECGDYLFHRIMPDLVISPTLDPDIPQSGGKILRVGPIVRSGIVPIPARQPPQRVVIMLSGSVFGTPVHLSRSYGIQVDILGRPAPEGWNGPANVVYHGKVTETRALLQQADVVVINGGFSAVSECFCLHKPMVVVPVPRHAEQWVNARTIEHLGVGGLCR